MMNGDFLLHVIQSLCGQTGLCNLVRNILLLSNSASIKIEILPSSYVHSKYILLLLITHKNPDPFERYMSMFNAINNI